jgi:diguanylate cyclase
MVKQYVPAVPENFHIWFEHVAGTDPDLSVAVESRIKNNQEFTSEVCAALFRRYILPKYASDDLRAVHEDVQSILRDALTSVSAAGSATCAYGESLQSSLGTLEKVTEPGDVREIVKTLAAKTVDMVRMAREVETELHSATKQVEMLQQQLRDTEEAVLIDPLTGLLNRKGSDERLTELELARRERGQTFSVVLADVDHFKKFNDTYGHQIGDAVLKLVGKVLRDSLKGKDSAGRYGGEEFIALLPETERDGASTVAQQIRRSIESQRLRIVRTEKTIPKITMSFGVAEFADTDTCESVVERADQALYLAKRSGRNLVKTELELAISA